MAEEKNDEQKEEQENAEDIYLVRTEVNWLKDT